MEGVAVILAVNGITGDALNLLMYVVVFLIGAAVFFGVNILAEWFERIEKTEEEIVAPGTCPHCGHKRKWTEQIPIFSWLVQKRRCAYCSEKLSARYALIELLGGVLAVLVVLYYGISLAALTVFAVYTVLSIISIVDADIQYIPPELNIILVVIGILSIWTLPGPTILERLIGVVCVSLFLFLVILIVPEGFGLGDVKLMAAIGVVLGWKGTVFAFFVGLILGGIAGCCLLLIKKKGGKYHFAFGPFLSIGIAISLYGQIGIQLVDMYIGTLVRNMTQPY